MGLFLGDDAHYVEATARLFGWQVDWQPRRHLRLRRGLWDAQAAFSSGGGFLHGQGCGPARQARELGLPELIGLLEREGRVRRPA